MPFSLTKAEWGKCKLDNIIQFGPDYRTYITIHSESHGESIPGPMSRKSIGEFVSKALDTNESVEINIKKLFRKDIKA